MLTEQRFLDFIAFFMSDCYTEIDWTRGVEFLEQELRAITRKTRRGQRAVDRLAKVWLLDGAEKWVLIHVEIQSQQDTNFPFRMFQYYYRAHDLFDGRPITCLAILGDDQADWKPQRYDNEQWTTSVSFKFQVIKLNEYANSLETMERSPNPFARFVLAHLKTVETRGDYETRLEWKLRLIKGLYDMSVSEAEIGQLCHDFDWLLTLPDRFAQRYHREITRFEEEKSMPHLSTAERIGRKIGRAEGREEGRQEGSANTARSILLLLGRKRFGEPDADIQKMLEAITSFDALEQLANRLLEAENWHDLLH